MFTVIELQMLCTESLILKYSVYLLPFFVYLLTNYVWQKWPHVNIETQPPSRDVNIDENIATGTDDGALRPSLPECEHILYEGITQCLDTSGDQFYKIANDRRSVRKFDRNRPVHCDVIQKCILAAGSSPSGAHTEPWTFCVIQNSQTKRDIRDIIEAEEYLNYSKRMSRQWTTDLRPLKTDFVKQYLTDAPYLIIVFKQVYGIRPDGTKQQHYYNEISTSISVGILLSALQSAGLNSLVTTPLNCGPAIRTLLKRPQNEKLLVLLPVGYAADDCFVPNLKRKSMDQIMVTF